MDAFSYLRATDIDAAVRGAGADGAYYIGGGTNLLDLLKSGVEHATTLIDITHLDLARIANTDNGGLRIGALARNSDTASDSEVRRRYPLLSAALLAGASQQLRNMATMGGNLMQRTRCHYFVDVGNSACNKRKPGSGCAALQGHNRQHAIFGASDTCIATHPSDMCVALAALEATVRIQGPNGERTMAFEDFHRLPGDDPQRDTNLTPGELITGVDLPPQGFAEHWHYLKIRDRASFAFALVSVAAGLDLDGDVVRDARVALGGVAHKPWRARETERQLIGKRLSAESIASAANAAVADAKPYRDNAFKVKLAPSAIVRAVSIAGGLA
ncbi:MAG TPA: xanthine dehydrogenase family protein subunit M [Rhodanobacteraceae bacterium]|nr:xanthine dehydrogenase family protein subunit M [Rhodanobacteraceae bacterium]